MLRRPDVPAAAFDGNIKSPLKRSIPACRPHLIRSRNARKRLEKTFKRTLKKALHKTLHKTLGKSRRNQLPGGPGKAIVRRYPRRVKRLILHTDIAFYGIVPAGRFAPFNLRILPTENHA